MNSIKSNKLLLDIVFEKNFKQVNIEKLENIDFEWLIDSFLVKQSLVMFYASAGSGKSYFMLYLSKYLLDNNKVDRIFYFDGDNNERILKERKGSEFLKSSNFYYFFSNNTNKFSLFRDLKKAKDLKNTLIVIDSIRNFIQDDFNKDFTMIKVFDELQKIRDNGATIIFLHHQPKQKPDENNKAYKGATTFLDSVDEGYFLHKKDIKADEEFVILLEPQKRRFATKSQAFKINTLNLEFEFVDYLEFAENHKTQITLNLVKEILNENKNGICQQDLASKIKKKIEQDYVEIVGRNALWKLLDKYKNIYWSIFYEAQEKGGKKKIFKI
ncbi:hypothetical protein FVL73_02260, partial [Campylobacter jejuni]|nr:hypothetical protein [Campylobacter jejuni]